jgi:Na+-translocating ferredoxin:NAD+ oxidoreductase subunit C
VWTTSFHGGIHPPSEKQRTSHVPIESLPAPQKVVIHLSQHAGDPAGPIVQSGDRVRIGQKIAEPLGQVSASVHASIAGKVVRIGQFPYPDGRRGPAIEIENDGSGEAVAFSPMDKSWREAALGELVNTIAGAGVVGMGGAAFPTHLKLSPPSNIQIHTLIINAIESEPYLTADHRIVIEKTEEILTGSLVARKMVGAKRTIIALESCRQDAIARVAAALKDPKYKDIVLVRLKPKYPQGSEKLLVQTIAGKQVPTGGSPAELGCIVLNVATVHAVCNAVVSGIPCYQRVVTVSGPAVRSPKNLLVPIGTPLRVLLDNCGFDAGVVRKVVMGGAMTGRAQSELDVTVQKSTAGVIAFDSASDAPCQKDCINCGSCVKTCPMRLVPSFCAKNVEKNKLDDAVAWGIDDCIECGSCAYVCPSRINLVHFMKLGKYLLARRGGGAHPGLEEKTHA